MPKIVKCKVIEIDCDTVEDAMEHAVPPPKPVTLTEMSSMGGRARAKKLTPQRRREIAGMGGKANAKRRK